MSTPARLAEPGFPSTAARDFRLHARATRVLVVFAVCALTSVDGLSHDDTQQTHVVIDEIRQPHKQPRKKIIDPCPDPDGKTSGRIQEGENLLTALQPDQALAICDEALQTKCPRLREQAQMCASQAIEERQTLTEVSQEIKTVDFYLTRYRYADARNIEASLRQLQSELAGNKSATYQSHVSAYIDTELEKRTGLKEQPWILKWLGKLGKILGIDPPPPSQTWVLWVIRWILQVLKWSIWGLLAIISIRLLFLGVDRLRNRRKELLDVKSWIVWSIADESNSGASGALMDALNWGSNPLLEKDNSGRRLMCWLAPPFLPDSPVKSAGNTTVVWTELLSQTYPGTLAPSEPTLWKISDDLVRANERVKKFFLDPAYQELDLTIGSFTIKGLSGLRKFVLQRAFRDVPSIIGVVTRRKAEGSLAWGVRLNANWPNESQTVSVFAESLPQEYGDPLGQVAQRAALKLMLRIAGIVESGDAHGTSNSIEVMDPSANKVTAQAAFRQGIELLRQLI